MQSIVHRLNTPIHHLVFKSFYRGDRLCAALQDHRAIVEAVTAGHASAAEGGLRYLSELDRNIHFGDG